MVVAKRKVAIKVFVCRNSGERGGDWEGEPHMAQQEGDNTHLAGNVFGHDRTCVVSLQLPAMGHHAQTTILIHYFSFVYFFFSLPNRTTPFGLVLFFFFFLSPSSLKFTFPKAVGQSPLLNVRDLGAYRRQYRINHRTGMMSHPR